MTFVYVVFVFSPNSIGVRVHDSDVECIAAVAFGISFVFYLPVFRTYHSGGNVGWL